MEFHCKTNRKTIIKSFNFFLLSNFTIITILILADNYYSLSLFAFITYPTPLINFILFFGLVIFLEIAFIKKVISSFSPFLIMNKDHFIYKNSKIQYSDIVSVSNKFQT